MRNWMAWVAACALLSAGPVWAAEGIAIGGSKADAGPTAEQRAEMKRAEREALEKRAQELADEEKQLLSLAAEQKELARTSCPELTRLKYPWIRCVENEWGGKELIVPGSGRSVGVTPMWDGPYHR